jgi:hypothetical protein
MVEGCSYLIVFGTKVFGNCWNSFWDIDKKRNSFSDCCNVGVLAPIPPHRLAETARNRKIAAAEMACGRKNPRPHLLVTQLIAIRLLIPSPLSPRTNPKTPRTFCHPKP